MSNIKINPLRSERFIIASEAGPTKNKLFQIIFGKDGSLFINFPYYKNSDGIVSLVKFPCDTSGPIDLSLEPGGKVTSHLVKYAHHMDGEAHFSQTQKVKTEIRKRSIPLHKVIGHIFTIQLQGTKKFEILKERDYRNPSSKRVLTLKLGSSEPEAIKIVGRWYSREKLIDRFFNPKSSVFEIGSNAEMIAPNGRRFSGTLLASPINNPSQDHILVLTSEKVPRIDKQEPSALTFIGGFDHHDIVGDTGRETSFLALSYPLLDLAFEELKERIGSIDLLTK